MANECYADFDIMAPDEAHAIGLMDKLQSMLFKQANGVCYLDLAGCALNNVYMYRSNLALKIEATVKWGFNDKEVTSLFRWFKQEGDICEFDLAYEQDGEHMYGEYVWEDTEPDIIRHVYLPEDQWPEDETSEDYFELIGERFEQFPEDRAIYLTRRKSTK